MANEKEWKRTLAWKLYEDRITVFRLWDEKKGEEMDLLWEAYDYEDKDGDRKSCNRSVKSKEAVKDLFCLRGMRFSAGKINLGSKILKAIGFLWSLHRRPSRRIASS